MRGVLFEVRGLHHAATANLVREIMMVRDNFLTLPGWFTRDDINDIIFSISLS